MLLEPFDITQEKVQSENVIPEPAVPWHWQCAFLPLKAAPAATNCNFEEDQVEDINAGQADGYLHRVWQTKEVHGKSHCGCELSVVLLPNNNEALRRLIHHQDGDFCRQQSGTDVATS